MSNLLHLKNLVEPKCDWLRKSELSASNCLTGLSTVLVSQDPVSVFSSRYAKRNS